MLGLDSHLSKVVGELLGHPLGQSGYEAALSPAHSLGDALQQVVNLPLGRLHLHDRVDQARGPDDLLDDLCAVLAFIGARRGGYVDGLVNALLELLEVEGAGCRGPRQAEAVVDEHLFAGLVAEVHAPDLREVMCDSSTNSR